MLIAHAHVWHLHVSQISESIKHNPCPGHCWPGRTAGAPQCPGPGTAAGESGALAYIWAGASLLLPPAAPRQLEPFFATIFAHSPVTARRATQAGDYITASP